MYVIRDDVSERNTRFLRNRRSRTALRQETKLRGTFCRMHEAKLGIPAAVYSIIVLLFNNC